MHKSIESILKGLVFPRENTSSLKRELAFQFVMLSTAVREFTVEFAVSRYRPDDIREVRNLLQAIIRSILSIRPNTNLFEASLCHSDQVTDIHDSIGYLIPTGEANASEVVHQSLLKPTRCLINAMKNAIAAADCVLLHMAGQSSRAAALKSAHQSLIQAKRAFDRADEALLNNPQLPSSYAKQPAVVDMLLFVHPVRQTSDKVEAFTSKVLQMQEADRGWRLLPPSYPWWKAIMRTNAQVRHDRGGLTAGFYFQSKTQLERMIKELQSTTYAPPIRPGANQADSQDLSIIGKYEQERELASKKNRSGSTETKVRYRVWEILHRLQGFESRFALKVTIVTTLLSIPAWLDQSRLRWSNNQSWWVVVIVWSQMHPRVGT